MQPGLSVSLIPKVETWRATKKWRKKKERLLNHEVSLELVPMSVLEPDFACLHSGWDPPVHRWPGARTLTDSGFPEDSNSPSAWIFMQPTLFDGTSYLKHIQHLYLSSWDPKSLTNCNQLLALSCLSSSYQHLFDFSSAQILWWLFLISM